MGSVPVVGAGKHAEGLVAPPRLHAMPVAKGVAQLASVQHVSRHWPLRQMLLRQSASALHALPYCARPCVVASGVQTLTVCPVAPLPSSARRQPQPAGQSFCVQQNAVHTLPEPVRQNPLLQPPVQL